MTENPEIPEWAMKAATDALNIDVWYEDGRSLLQESVALAIIKARSQAFAESEKIADDFHHGYTDQGAEGLYDREGKVCSFISQAIRQHSQKGRDNDL